MGPVQVRACLVWDTVKAVGILTDEVPFLSDEQAANCTHIEHAYHALSLNERRSSFKPMLWYTKESSAYPVLKQCWFLGHHSDVGGASYVGAANLSLAWMITQIQKNKVLDLDASSVKGYMNQNLLSEGKKLTLVDPIKNNLIWWVPWPKDRAPGKTLRDKKTHESIHWSVKKLRDQGALLDGIWRFQEEPDVKEEALTKEELQTLLGEENLAQDFLLHSFRLN